MNVIMIEKRAYEKLISNFLSLSGKVEVLFNKLDPSLDR